MKKENRLNDSIAISSLNIMTSYILLLATFLVDRWFANQKID